MTLRSGQRPTVVSFVFEQPVVLEKLEQKLRTHVHTGRTLLHNINADYTAERLIVLVALVVKIAL